MVSSGTIPRLHISATAGAVLPAVAERGRNSAEIALAPWLERLPELLMPSLFRFLMVFGLLGGLAYGAVFSLATFVKYKPREIIVTIPPDKFLKNH
jgi:hypothetical protein